jgi:TRAP-type C4-dicarboxylate transport system permease small subunit
MKRFENLAAALFGLIFIGLAVAVAAETLSRKIFNYSLQGVDELGGYALAVGGTLAFAVALVSRAHIRIDIVHEHMPRLLRILLNVAATVSLLACALALTWMGWVALSDSILFSSTAQTPWATPLRYPQAIWVGALAVFLLVCMLQALRMTLLIVRGRLDRVDVEYSPRGSKEELEEEIADLKARGAADIDLEKGLKA